MTLFDTLRERLGLDPRELAGATVSGEIPITDTLLNRLIGERLQQHAQVESVHVHPQEGDAAIIDVNTRLRLLPTLRITARIEQQPDLPRDPTLLIRWSLPAAGPLAMLAGPVLSYLKALPPGIHVEGERAVVNVAVLLQDRGLGDVLQLLRRLAVHTRPGAFVVRFEAGL